MAEEPSVGRRTALKTLGLLVGTVLGTSTVSATTGQREQSTSPPQGREKDPAPPQFAPGDQAELTGIYGGTVDRIVDGEHVVILIEDDGRVVDQHVVSADAYPQFDEGDSVSLWLYRGRVIAIW